MRRGFVLLFTVSVMCGCTSPTRPLSSANGATPTPSPTPPAVTGPAELTISNVSLWLTSPSQGMSRYWVTFSLAETSQRVGAVIVSAHVTEPAQSTEINAVDWEADGVGRIHIGAGSTSDAFAPRGTISLNYWSPLLTYPGVPPFVTIRVRFVDDLGAPGEVTTRFDLTSASCPNCAG
jgi:hypothetical protein